MAMARKLDSDEAIAFADDLMAAEVRANDELSLQSLGDKRDAVLWMSPELRAYFDKDSSKVLSES